ncbi:hypothetical protein B0H10DRAFT_2037786, partial [Mycena sp. CBHHK59/15]
MKTLAGQLAFTFLSAAVLFLFLSAAFLLSASLPFFPLPASSGLLCPTRPSPSSRSSSTPTCRPPACAAPFRPPA